MLGCGISIGGEIIGFLSASKFSESIYSIAAWHRRRSSEGAVGGEQLLISNRRQAPGETPMPGGVPRKAGDSAPLRTDFRGRRPQMKRTCEVVAERIRIVKCADCQLWSPP